MIVIPRRFVLDADFFIAYANPKDPLAKQAEILLDFIEEQKCTPEVSSEVFDDIITAYRSKKFPLKNIAQMIASLESLPLTCLSVTPDIANDALTIYEEHQGRGKLHYFDAFHIATTRFTTHRVLITSDKYIIKNSKIFDIEVIDLRKISAKIQSANDVGKDGIS